MGLNPRFDLGKAIGRTGAPFTLALIVLTATGFLAFWLASGGPEGPAPMMRALTFEPFAWVSRPWTLLTYVLANPGVGPFLCVLIELFFFGTALEQALGTRRFALLYLGLTAISALLFWVGCFVTGIEASLTTGLLPAAACVVAWATRNPGATVLVWFVLPVRAFWLGWLVSVLTVIWFTYGAPIMAPFVGAPLALAYLFASGRFSPRLGTISQRPRKRGHDYEGVNWDRRRQAEEERRRLKELFERSWRDDDPEGR